ncbi:hypothetical protein [Rhodococcoides fascians]|uniref:hypothetical protein n=1 Tax=Rhodococcoides fascians TaxID=1828 RepID=UPI00056144A6|nr:hypothetical protein [Rhodococcus fascians]
MTTATIAADTFTLVEWSPSRWYAIQNGNRADWDSSDIGTRAEAVAWMKARGGLVKNARIDTFD